MPEEVKYFNGSRINSDDSIDYFSPTDILGGYNFRIQSQEDNSQGLAVAVEGSREISTSLPQGTNTFIRGKYFPSLGKAILFVKNSTNRNSVFEFDPQTESLTKIYTNIDDSGGANILNWNNVDYIKDVVIVQNKMLYWVEFPSDVVRRVDIDRAKSGGYGTFTFDDFMVLVRPPIIPPTAEYESDNSYNYNNLKGSLFQFRYLYEFDNYERSVYSPISNRALPVEEQNIASSTDISNNNAIVVSVDAAWNRVRNLHISFRIGNGDWYHLKTVSREHILSLPDADISFMADRREVYNPGDNLYRFVFYNDALYIPESQLEHDQLADYAPLNSRAIEAVNDNTISLGNNLYGYDEVDMSEEDARADVTYEATGGTVGGFGVVSFDVLPPFGSGNFRVVFTGAPTEDDIIRSTWIRYSAPVNASYNNYYVSAGTSGDLYDTILAYSSSLTGLYGIESVNVTDNGGTVTLEFHTNEANPNQRFPTSFSITNAIPINDSISTIKLQSSYQLAVAYYDKQGRPFPLYTNSNMVVKTDAFASTEGMVPVIRWFLPEQAPPLADHYRICITKNRTHAGTWYTTASRAGKQGPVNGVTTYSLNIEPMFLFNKINPTSTLVYDFVSGDRVNVIGKIATDGTVTLWHNSPIYNFKIRGMFINQSGVEPDVMEWHSIAFEVDDATVTIDEGEDYLIEIYRPKAQMSAEVEPYYELPFIYKVVNGDHDVRVGEVRAVDSFIRSRTMMFTETEAQGVIPAESFHFSDLYESDYDQLGRPRTLNDTPASNRYKTEIRYSREWVSGSRVNGINRFFPEDVYDSRAPMYGASETYGGIQYLSVRENRMVCLQELKLGYIPVNRSIIQDTLEQEQVAISSKLFNPIQYSVGPNMGIGNDEAIPSYQFVKGMIYFVDPHEMLPVRATTNSIGYITYKAADRMKTLIRNAVAGNTRIYGLWDDEHNEYLMVIGGNTEVWSEISDGWVPYRTFQPTAGFSANDRFYSAGGGELYIHDDDVNRANLHGVQYGAMIDAPINSQGVKNYHSIAIHSDHPLTTEPTGGLTQMGQVFDLIPEDMDEREGIFYANLPRDYGTDPVNGDRLKGRWISMKLLAEPEPGQSLPEVNLLKVVVKSSMSTPNE